MLQPELQQDLNALSQLFVEIKHFNQSHNSANAISSFIFSVVTASIGEDSKIEQGPSNTKSVSQEAEEISQRHRATLAKFGLELCLDRDRHDINSYLFNHDKPLLEIPTREQEKFHTHSLDLGLVDETKLLSIFKNLQLRDTQSESAKDLIMFLASELDKNVVRAWLIDHAKIEEENSNPIYGIAEEIASEFQRLNLHKQAETLVSHLEHVWQESLRELLLAENAKILPSEGFRPHNWHLDSTPERFSELWHKALSTLEQISENPRAHAIYSEAKTYLADSIEIASSYYQAQSRNENLSPLYRERLPKFFEIIDDLQRQIVLI